MAARLSSTLGRLPLPWLAAVAAPAPENGAPLLRVRLCSSRALFHAPMRRTLATAAAMVSEPVAASAAAVTPSSPPHAAAAGGCAAAAAAPAAGASAAASATPAAPAKEYVLSPRYGLPIPKDLPEFEWSDVLARRNHPAPGGASTGPFWIVIDSIIYDVSKLRHPGGGIAELFSTLPPTSDRGAAFHELHSWKEKRATTAFAVGRIRPGSVNPNPDPDSPALPMAGSCPVAAAAASTAGQPQQPAPQDQPSINAAAQPNS